MPYMSPGAEASSGILDFLTEREKMKQLAIRNGIDIQRMQMEREQAAELHTQRMEQMQLQHELRKQQMDEKSKAETMGSLEDRFGLNDFMDPQDPDVLKAKQLGILPRVAKVETYQPVTSNAPLNPTVPAVGGVTQTLPAKPPAIRFLGSDAQRKEAHANEVINSVIDQMPEGPQKNAVRMFAQLRTAGVTVPAGLADAIGQVNQKPSEVPQYTLDPVSGQLKRVGTTEPGSQIHMVPQAAAAAVQLPPEEHQRMVDTLAKKYVYDEKGLAGDLGIGNAGAQLKQEAIARASHYNPATGQFDAVKPPDLLKLRAQYKADHTAAIAQKKAIAAIDSFADAAAANKALLLSMHPTDTGVSWLNVPVRAVVRAVGGMRDYDAVLKSLQTEYGKLISASGGLSARELSATMQKSMEKVVDHNTPLSGVIAALDALQKESENRKVAYQQNYDKLLAPYGESENTPTPTKGGGGDIIDAASFMAGRKGKGK